jgi:protein subunit release factor A
MRSSHSDKKKAFIQLDTRIYELDMNRKNEKDLLTS